MKNKRKTAIVLLRFLIAVSAGLLGGCSRNPDRAAVASNYAEAMGPEAAGKKMKQIDEQVKGKSDQFLNRYWPGERAASVKYLANAKLHHTTWQEGQDRRERIRVAMEQSIISNGNLNFQQAVILSLKEDALIKSGFANRKSGAVSARLEQHESEMLKRYKMYEKEGRKWIGFGLVDLDGNHIGTFSLALLNGAELELGPKTMRDEEAVSPLKQSKGRWQVIDKGMASYGTWHLYTVKIPGEADSRLDVTHGEALLNWDSN